MSSLNVVLFVNKLFSFQPLIILIFNSRNSVAERTEIVNLTYYFQRVINSLEHRFHTIILPLHK